MKTDDFWDGDAILTDLMFTTNKSVAEIAEVIGWTPTETSERIKHLGLSWIRRNNKKLSRGHAALTDIMRKLLPSEEIINEYHVGERLMLDVYCPKFKIGAEYHGRQHFFYSNLFHKDKFDFLDGQKRDERKIELCKEQGISLIVFRYSDKLTDEAVFERMLEAIRATPYVEKPKSTAKDNPYYEKIKQQRREYNKAAYRRMKEQRNS